ncbi:MAG: hypothetical protein ABEJ75_04150 [Candidatus Nanohaloarchaea archaeon]
MFDFGDDDKNKLRENMEEIKRLINEGGDARGQPQGGQPDQPAPEPEPEQGPQEPDFSQPADNQEEGFDQIGGQPQQEGQQAPGSQETTGQNPFQQEQQTPGSQETAGQGTGPGQEELEVPGEQSRRSGGTEVTAEDLQESLPDIEEEEDTETETSGETVFLTVERFEGLQDRLEEMRYLTQEIEDVVDHLQAGAEEDSQTAEEAQQILQDFGRRRAEVEDIVLSHED